MTEKEYINASTLGKVKSLTTIIGDASLALCDSIPEEELKQVLPIIFGWQDKLFEAISIE